MSNQPGHYSVAVQQLRQAMMTLDLNQKALATLARVNQSSISRLFKHGDVATPTGKAVSLALLEAGIPPTTIEQLVKESGVPAFVTVGKEAERKESYPALNTFPISFDAFAIVVQHAISLDNGRSSMPRTNEATWLLQALLDETLASETRTAALNSRDQRVRMLSIAGIGTLGHNRLTLGFPEAAETDLAMSRLSLERVNWTSISDRRMWDRTLGETTGRTLDEFRQWLAHMHGLVTASSAQQRKNRGNPVRGAPERAREILRRAQQGLPRDSLELANINRDLAWMLRTFTSETILGIRELLDVSLKTLERLDDKEMMAVTLMQRARWHDRAGKPKLAWRDTEAALLLSKDSGALGLSVHMQAAKILRESDPDFAIETANRVLEAASHHGLEGLAQQARLILADTTKKGE